VLEILLPAAVAFATTFWLTPKMMGYLSAIGVLGIDQNKKNKPRIPTSGGIAVAFGLFCGLLTYIAVATFVLGQVNLTLILASTIAIETITVIGFLDDIVVERSKTRDTSGTLEYRRGLRQWQKAIMVLPAAIPLMAINAGHTTMIFPFIGSVEFGLLYPLLLVPLGVLCVSNATNMLAGVNGLESGLGAVALAGLAVLALALGRTEAALIAVVGVSALLAFLYYNWYPARVLPGDSLTYLVGSVFVTAVIVGNIEKFGILIFAPWIVEALIKARHGFRATSLGQLTRQGYLKPKNNRIESLTHVAMSLGNLRERCVAAVLIAVEAAIVAATLGLWALHVI